MGKEAGRLSESNLVQFKANVGLVHLIVEKYVGHELKQQYWDDLISEGQIGLLKAVERFDPNRGFKFSALATRIILSHVRRFCIEKTNNIHIPEYSHRKFMKEGFVPTEPCHLVAKNTRQGYSDLNDANSVEAPPTTAYCSQSILEMLDSMSAIDCKILSFKCGVNDKSISICKELGIDRKKYEKKWSKMLPKLKRKLDSGDTIV